MSYNAQETFEDAKFVVGLFGLNLTLIEQVRLKEYVPLVLDELASFDRRSWHRPNGPGDEAALRFLVDYYGIPPEFYEGAIYTDKKFREYLRIQQEKAHFP